MDIAEIKQTLTLAQVLTHFGFKPDKHARMHWLIHDDNRVSLQV